MIFCLRLSFDHLMTGSRPLLLPLGLKMVLFAHCQLQRKPPSSACTYRLKQVKQLRELHSMAQKHPTVLHAICCNSQLRHHLKSSASLLLALSLLPRLGYYAGHAPNRHFPTHVQQMWSAGNRYWWATLSISSISHGHKMFDSSGMTSPHPSPCAQPFSWQQSPSLALNVWGLLRIRAAP